jgi:hypothetical protein
VLGGNTGAGAGVGAVSSGGALVAGGEVGSGCRGGGETGSELPEAATSTSAVTQTGVWSLLAE